MPCREQRPGPPDPEIFREREEVSKVPHLQGGFDQKQILDLVEILPRGVEIGPDYVNLYLKIMSKAGECRF